jgi:hypothetical protein
MFSLARNWLVFCSRPLMSRLIDYAWKMRATFVGGISWFAPADNWTISKRLK